jgi:transcription elongation GreA/GreB family factor
MFYFLQGDLDKLIIIINGIKQKLRESGQDIGESCRQAAETYHDNAPYEEAVRSFEFHSIRLSSLVEIRQSAEIIRPPENNDKVRVGHRVRILDMVSDEIICFTVGSYLVFSDDHVSYNSPLAKLLLGAKVGEIKSGRVGNRDRELLILEIIAPENK